MSLLKQYVIMYRKIKNKITPTIRTTNAPTIPTTVKGRFFDNFSGEPVGSVTINKKYLTSISLLALCYYRLT